MTVQKLEFVCKELIKPSSEIRFIDNGQGKIDVYGKFHQGYIDVDKKVFQQDRWCTLPIDYEATIESLTNDIINYLHWFENGNLGIMWDELKFSVDFSIDLTLEESFYMLQETTVLINKLKEISQQEIEKVSLEESETMIEEEDVMV